MCLPQVGDGRRGSEVTEGEGGIPPSTPGSFFAFCELKVSNMVHTFCGFVGKFSYAQKAVCAVGHFHWIVDSIHERKQKRKKGYVFQKYAQKTNIKNTKYWKKGYLNHDEVKNKK